MLLWHRLEACSGGNFGDDPAWHLQAGAIEWNEVLSNVYATPTSRGIETAKACGWHAVLLLPSPRRRVLGWLEIRALQA